MPQHARTPAPSSWTQDPEEVRRRADIAKVPVAMALLDLELRPLVLSAGWRREAVCPDQIDQPLCAHFVGDALRQARAAALSGTIALQVEAVSQADAPRRWWSMTLGPWPADGSPAQQLVLNAREVTDVVLAAFAAQQAQQRLAMALKLDRSVVREANLQTGEVTFSSMCPDLEAHFRDRPLEACASPQDRPFLAVALNGCAKQGRPFKQEFRLARTDGEETWICAMGERFSDISGEEQRMIVVLKDVTEHQRHQRHIEALAFKDPLTGLANRAAFQAAFDQAVVAAKDGERFGLVMLDLDFFKQINDAMGHDAGDAVLKGVAGQLRRAFRQSDVVARLGGDEFAVLLRGIDDEDALVRPIEALRELLRTPVQHGGESLVIGASIGAALHHLRDEDPRQIFKNADVALYQAKLGGRGRSVVFEPAMRSETDDRRQLMRDVRKGLSEGQFSLAYQPILDLQTRRIDGLEALLRWERPGHGLLAPGQFLAALEDHELGLKLGELTLDMTMAQVRQWTDLGLDPPTVSINISAGQLRNRHLAEDIAGKLSQWNLPANVLALEISESVYGGGDVAVTISKLDALGVRVTLDDFGAAYASLGNLRRFPINRLKIGKAFVASLDEEIIGSILRLGAALGVQVVADGVEAENQLAAIRRQGCAHAQGYYLARPMSAHATGDYLAGFPQAAVA